jgi:hypothetical protein
MIFPSLGILEKQVPLLNILILDFGVTSHNVIDQSMIINFEMKKIFEVKPSKILGILHRLQYILIYSPSSHRS